MSKIKGFISSCVAKHPVFSTIAFGTFVCACLLVLFWFVVFSGLSSSADFVYNHF